jgi:hypothetical protein
MKNLTNILLVIMIILCVGSYMKKNHISFKSPFKPKVDPMVEFKSRLNKVVFKIHGWGNFDTKSLYQAQEIIKNEFGIESIIENSVSVPSSAYDREGMINLKNYNIKEFWGYTFDNNMFVNTIDFKNTLIHEIGHWELLSHCENKNCYMNINCSQPFNFCNECTLKLNKFKSKQQ